jgi:hypothetical protein
MSARDMAGSLSLHQILDADAQLPEIAFTQQIEVKSAGINLPQRRNPNNQYNILFGRIQQMGRLLFQ